LSRRRLIDAGGLCQSMARQQLNNDLALSQSILYKKYLVLIKLGDNKLLFTDFEMVL
jgi:hypothetical protein